MVLSDCCGFCAVSRAHVEGRWPFAVATCVQLPSQRLHIVLTQPAGVLPLIPAGLILQSHGTEGEQPVVSQQGHVEAMG